jgi:hypothetical protein
MNMLQYGSGVLPDYKAPARQRTFQCCLSTLGPYDDPVCILITLYHIEAHYSFPSSLGNVLQYSATLVTTFNGWGRAFEWHVLDRLYSWLQPYRNTLTALLLLYAYRLYPFV